MCGGSAGIFNVTKGTVNLNSPSASLSGTITGAGTLEVARAATVNVGAVFTVSTVVMDTNGGVLSFNSPAVTSIATLSFPVGYQSTATVALASATTVTVDTLSSYSGSSNSVVSGVDATSLLVVRSIAYSG